MQEKIQEFRRLVAEKKKLNASVSVLQWELETIVPRQGQNYLSEVLAYLSMKDYALSTSEKFQTLVYELLEKREDLDPLLEKELELAVEEMEKMKKIPAAEYEAYAELCAKTQAVWEEAKRKNQFSLVEENLTKIFEYNRKFATYRRKEEECLYDVLLSDYEKGMTSKKLEEFFQELKKAIVPLLHRIQSLEKKTYPFLESPVEKEVQRKVCRFLADYLGFDFLKGVLAESEHPFTLHIDNKDVRITTNYKQKQAFSAIFSTIHEIGHALYEQQIADELVPTLLGSGGSMALHESQSRFWENIIGRSQAFWEEIYEDLQKDYSCLADIPLEDFYLAINQVEASFIRTEADELTYSLHIMLRYELEKALLEGEIAVKDLPSLWKEKMQEYLGISPSCDQEAVLQDVHWYAGLIGYFPSYALGSAYAAQLFHSLEKEISLDSFTKENIDRIRAWLGEKIHRFGMSKDTVPLMEDITGESLNSNYYIDYLETKFKKIYHLS